MALVGRAKISKVVWKIASAEILNVSWDTCWRHSPHERLMSPGYNAPSKIITTFRLGGGRFMGASVTS
jgi:hypothetical protein